MSFLEFAHSINLLSRTTSERFVPHRFQEGLITALDYNQNVLLWQGRQMGITTILSLFSFHFALKNRGKTVMISGSHHRHFDSVIDVIRLLGGEMGEAVFKDRVVFENGSKIVKYNPNHLRSTTIDLFIGDNADMTFEDFNLMRMCMNDQSRVVMAGMQNFHSDLLTELWNKPEFYAARLQFPCSMFPGREKNWHSERVAQNGPAKSYSELSGTFPKE
jgi:hypothetical protein